MKNAEGEVEGRPWDSLHVSIEYWKHVNPHAILFALLPPLLFESAYGVDYHVFQKVAPMAVLMAGPGVLVATLLTMVPHPPLPNARTCFLLPFCQLRVRPRGIVETI